MAWLKTIPRQFLPASIQSDADFAALSGIQPASSFHCVPTLRRRSAACSDILRITDCLILVVVAKQRQVDRVGHGPVAAIVRMQMIAAVIRRQQA
jgi:hypothetical protein